MADDNVLEELDKAISAQDWDTASNLRDEAIVYIVESLMGDDTEGLYEQIWALHQIQSKLYEKL